MIRYKITTIIIFGLLLSKFTVAQDMLIKTEAVEIALENNYNIKIARNNVESASNNASIYNSGYLPSFQGSAGINYSSGSSRAEFQDGSVRETNSAQSTAYSSSLGLNYTLFDGLGRKYNYAMQKEFYSISELLMRQVIELNILDIFRVYYDVARLTTNEINQNETLAISTRRLDRARYGYDYGQNTQLDVLNAEVDYNNDSITYLTIIQELENSKRDLNVLLGRDVNTLFVVDTAIVYEKEITLDMHWQQADNSECYLSRK